MAGTPARLRMTRPMARVSQLSLAYSSMYSAVATPRGKATTMMMRPSWMVPMRAW